MFALMLLVTDIDRSLKHTQLIKLSIILPSPLLRLLLNVFLKGLILGES